MINIFGRILSGFVKSELPFHSMSCTMALRVTAMKKVCQKIMNMLGMTSKLNISPSWGKIFSARGERGGRRRGGGKVFH